MITDQDIERLEELAKKATPGPWAWFGTHKAPYLATEHSGRLYVMGFARSGMNGAQPVFRSREGRHELLKKGEELAVFAVNRSAISADDPSVYRKDIVGFRPPDASWIALANPSTILSLIERVKEAEGRIKALRAFAEKECIAAEIDATADTDSLDRMHGGGRAVAYAKIIARIDLPALMETRE